MRYTKTLIFIIFTFILVSGFTCNQNNNSGFDDRRSPTGTDGITLSFLPNAPQDRYLVGDIEEKIDVILEVRNKGAWPQTEGENIMDRGKVYVSGFDDEIIRLDDRSKILNKDFLQGLSLINPDGGFDTAEFKGGIQAIDLLTDTYNPTILATACFPYVTKAGPPVCIDPEPFDTKREKVCSVGSTTLSSQGAPIAITRIDQEASSSKITFKITIKNVGGGDVLKLSSLEGCNPYGVSTLTRQDFDKVELIRATVGISELQCGPFIEGKEIRLFNGEGSIFCTLLRSEYENEGSAYTTPLNIELSYGYRKTASKQIRISKITGIN